MKLWKPIAGGLLFCAGLLLTGCHDGIYIEDGPYYDNESEIYVRESPPASRVEVISARPGADYIWIDGSWAWHDQWQWRSGSWARQPRHDSVWVRSSWTHEREGWGYHRGKWKD